MRQNGVVKRIQGQNSVYKKFLEIVGNGKFNGQCSRGDNCSFRHDINKRGKIDTVEYVSEILLRGRMTKMHRELMSP